MREDYSDVLPTIPTPFGRIEIAIIRDESDRNGGGCRRAFSGATSDGQAAEPPRPNVVVIVADDLGWADVGWHGSRLKTPNLDRLAREGVRLEQHYVAPMCTPTRVALLTGRYWSRFGISAADNRRALEFDTVTLARMFKAAGYDTAITGKWHLGSEPDWGPQHFGFDYSYGSLAGGVGPYDHRYKKGPYTKTWHRNGVYIEEQGHVTDLITQEAIKWLEGRADRPFFLYVPFTAVHIPIDEPQAWLDLYPDIEPLSRRHYAACVSHMDDSVGRIVKAIDRLGRRQETLIVFFSDNGAMPNARNDDPLYPPGNYAPGPAGGSNKPLRGQKTQVYEGGVRVPSLIRWPEHLKPGTFDAPMGVVDWMPTLGGLVGYRPDKDLKWDGIDMWPCLMGQRQPVPRQIYCAGVHFRESAVRDGSWKLIQRKGNTAPALFNLATDPDERANLSAQETERVQSMRALMTELSARDNDAKVREP